MRSHYPLPPSRIAWLRAIQGLASGVADRAGAAHPIAYASARGAERPSTTGSQRFDLGYPRAELPTTSDARGQQARGSEGVGVGASDTRVSAGQSIGYPGPGPPGIRIDPAQ